MEALFDKQTHILEEKLQTLRPIAEKLENNIENVENGSPDQKSKKRNLEYEQGVLSKMFKLQDDEEDD